FSLEWLTLREPADRAARSPALVTELRTTRPQDGELRVVDLGTGSGANLRFMAPLLGGTQHWLALDDDAALLATLPREFAGTGFGCRVHAQRRNLAEPDALSWSPGALVTASALLDLV